MSEQIPPPPPAILAALTQAAESQSVPLELLTGVAWVESRFNPGALSPRGARGLMQLSQAVLTAYGNPDPYDPMRSAAIAAAELARLQKRFGGWHRATAAYVWGEGNVLRHPDPSQWPQAVLDYTARVRSAARYAPLPFPGEVIHVALAEGYRGPSPFSISPRSGAGDA